MHVGLPHPPFFGSLAFIQHVLLTKKKICLLLQLKKHLVTASYVDESMSLLDEKAKSAGITILGEMGLDPGIGNLSPCT